MPSLPPGWQTDLAVLRLTGSTIDDRGDHLLVRSPANPDHHWGNCIVVTDPAAIDGAQRWLHTFEAAFPAATWVAIGLPAMPADQRAWTELGLDLELEEVLTTGALPRLTPRPDGYAVRRLNGADDWASHIRRAVAENDRTHDHDPTSFERYVTARAQARRALSERDGAAFFGAFSGDRLVADLGIVRCGTTARYQAVGTDEEHRRRGLASHLLGVAARWAADHDCDRWVILTEATNPAGRVYRSLGFEPDLGNVQAYRKEPYRPRS